MAFEEYNGPQLQDVTKPPRDFEGLSEDKCIELVKDWFFDNFEDPVHHDMHISAEGGYQYIWGGPYDASEILYEAFEEVLSEEIIKAAINDIESDGTYNWTVASTRVLPPEEDPQIPFDEMQKYISELESALAEIRNAPAGIGHNKPPEPLEQTPLTVIDIQNINININILKEQKPYEIENKEQVSGAFNSLKEISSKLGEYFADKGKIFIDEAVKAAGAEIGKRGTQLGAIYTAYEILEKIIQSGIQWMQTLL